MTSTQGGRDRLASAEHGGEYTAGDSRRHIASPRVAASRLRVTFFVLAALWGFILGVGAFAAALAISGRRADVNASVLGYVVPGALVAMAGGIVASKAYREVRERMRK